MEFSNEHYTYVVIKADVQVHVVVVRKGLVVMFSRKLVSIGVFRRPHIADLLFF